LRWREKASYFALTCLDEISAAEAEGGPVVVDGDGAHGVKAEGAEGVPAGVTVEVAGVFLRGAFGPGEPEDGIAGSAFGELGSEFVDFRFARDEGEEEFDWWGGGQSAMEGAALERGERRLKARGRVEDDELLLGFEVELVEDCGHGKEDTTELKGRE
jgi:hypothetical protein